MNFLSKLFHLSFVPKGLTLAAGWLSILNALRCLFGLALPGIDCAPNPGEALTSALAGLGFIGLGRR
jgi:hypothetical protein